MRSPEFGSIGFACRPSLPACQDESHGKSSAAALARRAGVPAGTLRNWEGDRGFPHPRAFLPDYSADLHRALAGHLQAGGGRGRARGPVTPPDLFLMEKAGTSGTAGERAGPALYL
jgi:hypothetical protein